MLRELVQDEMTKSLVLWFSISPSFVGARRSLELCRRHPT